MACKGCGSLPPVRIKRLAVGSKVPVIRQAPLRPKRKMAASANVPKPGNDLDKHRA